MRAEHVFAALCVQEPKLTYNTKLALACAAVVAVREERNLPADGVSPADVYHAWERREEARAKKTKQSHSHHSPMPRILFLCICIPVAPTTPLAVAAAGEYGRGDVMTAKRVALILRPPQS